MPPVLIGVGVGAAVGGFAFGSITAAVVGGVIGGVGMLALDALAPKTNLPSPNYQSDVQQNTASSIYPVQLAFGSAGMAGNFIRSTRPGQLHREIIIGLGEGPLNGIQRFRYQRKDRDTIGLKGQLPTLVFLPGDGSQTAPDATAFPDIHAEGDVQDYRFTSTLWVRITGHQFTRSGQQTLITLEGRQCWKLADTGTREFSRNPAVIAATYLHDIKNKSWDEIDIASFQDLESYCNQYGSEISEYSEDLMGAGEIAASDTHEEDVVYAPSQVLKEGDTFWASGGVVNCTLTYDFGADAGVRIARYHLRRHASLNWPTDWILQGSNDNSLWTDLHTVTGHSWSAQDEYFDVPSGSIDRYRYYRLAFSGSTGTQIVLLRWRMFAYLGQVAPRYRFDYIFDNFQSMTDIEKEIGRSFHGKLVASQAKIKPVWLKNSAPVYDFTKDNIEQGTVSAGEDEVPNLCRITYRNRARDFRRDTVEARDDDDIALRGEVVYEEQCDFITDREIALRRVQFLFDYKRLCPGWLKLQSGQWPSALEEYDVVTVTHPLCPQDGKLYSIEEKQEDRWGRVSFKLREYSTAVFHDRLAANQDHLAGPSGAIGEVQSPEAPDLENPSVGLGATALTGGALAQWETPTTTTSFQIARRVQDQSLSQDSGWSEWIGIQGSNYTYLLTDDERTTYGEDALISFKAKTVNTYGTESPESNPVTVTALPLRGTVVEAYQGDGTDNPITLSQPFRRNSVILTVNGRTWIPRLAATESPDVWEYEEQETVPGNGTWQKIAPRSSYVLHSGVPIVVEYKPA